MYIYIYIHIYVPLKEHVQIHGAVYKLYSKHTTIQRFRLRLAAA